MTKNIFENKIKSLENPVLEKPAQKFLQSLNIQKQKLIDKNNHHITERKYLKPEYLSPLRVSEDSGEYNRKGFLRLSSETPKITQSDEIEQQPKAILPSKVL